MFASRTGWNLQPNRFTQTLERLRNSGSELLDLSASNPTLSGFHYDGSRILSALASPQGLQYQPVPFGMESARNAVAEYYLENGSRISPSQIVLTTSTSEAYTYCFRLLCDPGDDVLIARPSYPLFDLLAGIQDVNLRSFSLIYDHGWQIDFHSLEQAITSRTRAIVLVHPNNPTGSFVKPDELEQLNRICERHDLALICDEVFLDYAPGPARKSFSGNDRALTFTLSGLSKIAGLPQMKAAWIVVTGREEVKQAAIARLEVIADTYLSMNAPVQHALSAMLESRHALQRQMMERIQINLAELDRQLLDNPQCVRLTLEGGWYAVLRIPAHGSDEDFVVRLLEEHGVIAHPGHFFDFEADGYLILSLITPQNEFREGVRRILTSVS